MLAKWFGKLAQMIATEGTVPRNCVRKIAISYHGRRQIMITKVPYRSNYLCVLTERTT